MAKKRKPITHWNYRVLRRRWARFGVVEYTYGFYECYYATRRSAYPHSITVNEVSAMGETPEELMRVHAKMGVAFAKPVLDYKTLRPIK